MWISGSIRNRAHRLLPAVLLLAAPVLFSQTATSLQWAGYLPGFRFEAARAVAPAPDGTVWVAGASSSTIDFPGPNSPFQSQPKGKKDIFLARYRPAADGTAKLLFWTWIGGTGDEEVSAIALDNKGRVYITGTTDSIDFPTMNNPFQTALSGEVDGYVAIVDPTFTGIDTLVFASYYGGTKSDYPRSIFVEPGGAAVIAGYTTSDDLPNINGAQHDNRGGWDAFLLRIESNGAPQYGTYFGGNSTDIATGVTVDANGIIWFTGYTASEDFPLTGNAYHQNRVSPTDGFLVGIDPRKSGLDGHVYGSYFGGSSLDVPQSVKAVAGGTLWIAGYTFSTDLPVTPDACQASSGGAVDSFVMRLDPARSGESALRYLSYFGGTGYDILNGFTVMSNGRLGLAGYTTLGQLPIAGSPVQSSPSPGLADAFVAILNPAADTNTCLVYSTYLGGGYDDVATDIGAGPDGLFVSGYSTSTDLPVTDGSTKQQPPALPGAWVAKIITQ